MFSGLKRVRSQRAQKVAEYGASVSLRHLLALRRYARAIDLQQRIKVTTQLAGGYRSTLRGRGMDFDEVRIYQPGDDIRSMDWRVTARTGEPHTKLFHEEKERPVILIVDQSPSLFFGSRCAFKSAVAAKMAALIAWSAIESGDKLGGIIFSGKQAKEFLPRTRKFGILPMLKELSDCTQPFSANDAPDALSLALKRARRVVKPGSTVVVISDFLTMNETAAQHLSRLALHNQLFAFSMSDALEHELPPPDFYSISDGHQQMMMDTHSKKNRLAFQQQFQLQQTQVANSLKKANIPHLHCMTDDEIEKKVIHFFRAYGS